MSPFSSADFMPSPACFLLFVFEFPDERQVGIAPKPVVWASLQSNCFVCRGFRRGRRLGACPGGTKKDQVLLAKPTLGSKDRRIEGEGCAHLVRFLLLVRSVALL